MQVEINNIFWASIDKEACNPKPRTSTYTVSVCWLLTPLPLEWTWVIGRRKSSTRIIAANRFLGLAEPIAGSFGPRKRHLDLFVLGVLVAGLTDSNWARFDINCAGLDSVTLLSIGVNLSRESYSIDVISADFRDYPVLQMGSRTVPEKGLDCR